jgi:pimeloyl-ACP methyl ester carboxylesterase
MKEVAGHPTITFGDGDRTLVVVPGLSDAFPASKGSKLSEVLLERYYYGAFTSDYTVHVVGRPPLDEGTTTREMASGYGDVLNSLGGNVDVLGLSLGGMVAQYVAADYGDDIRRLVLGVTGYRLSEEGRRIVEGWKEMALEGNWEGVYVDAVETTYARGYREKVYATLARLPIGFFEPSVDDFVTSCDALLEHDAADDLDGIEARTLVVGGSDDVLFPDGIVEETARRIPHGELHVVEDCGHGAFEERKDEFNGEALRFLME